MVDADDINADLAALRLNALHLLDSGSEQLLCAKDLVAAAVGFDLGELTVQSTDTYSHGIGIVQDRGLGTATADVGCDPAHHGNRAQPTDKTAGAGSVAHRLPDTVLLGGVYVHGHFVEGTGQDGDDNKVGIGQGFVNFPDGFVLPAFTVDPVADDLIVLRRFKVDIVQIHGAGNVSRFFQVVHQCPCPAPGAAANVGNLQIFCGMVFLQHSYHACLFVISFMIQQKKSISYKNIALLRGEL